jgi:hypothetical protein
MVTLLNKSLPLRRTHMPHPLLVGAEVVRRPATRAIWYQSGPTSVSLIFDREHAYSACLFSMLLKQLSSWELCLTLAHIVFAWRVPVGLVQEAEGARRPDMAVIWYLPRPA